MSTGIHIPHSSKLVAWFAARYDNDPSAFPGIGKRNYVTDFLSLDDHLNKFVHTKTEVLQRIADNTGYLTDHGPEHIKMVMHRAASLICLPSDTAEFDTKLSPYEVFILIMAIHFHDVGNRYGREGHETRILEVMARLSQMQVFSSTEQRLIAKIASTHGGKVGHDKDTIRKILPEGTRFFGGVSYRPQLIAAILRLADELAEDNSRADTFALLGPSEIPEESLIYHKYAERIDSIAINVLERKLELEFSLYHDDVQTQYGKGKDSDGVLMKRFLLDEVLDRTKKTFLEAIYCNRFLREELGISFTTVNVQISPFDNSNSLEPFRAEIKYSLKETGYPFENQSVDISSLCPELKNLSGASLKNELQTLEAAK
jgi:hypothetical protein